MPYIGKNPDKGNFSDLNGGKLILDADADTSITADTDDQIDIEIAGADELKITSAMLAPASADGSALGGTSNEWSDLYLADSGVIYFGNDQDVTVTHDPDDGLFLKSTATSDDNPFLLTLQTGETDMAASDIIGALQFQAPDEGTGTDAILVSAAVKAYAEGDHSSSSNATSLAFYTGASEVATEKMTIHSSGKVGIGVTGSSIDEIFHIGTSTNDATLKMESTGGNAMIDIVGNRTSDADIGHLRFHNGSTAALAQMRVERSGANNTGNMKLQVNNAGSMTDLLTLDVADVTVPTGNIVFSGAGKGVYLGVTSATAANLLDDYEEGTFTGVFKIGGTGGTDNSSGGATGYYTKIGNTVQFEVSIVLDNTRSGTGSLVVTGLPFTTARSTPINYRFNDRMDPSDNVVAYTANGNTYAGFLHMPSSTSDTSISCTESIVNSSGGGKNVILSGVYQV